MKYPYVLAAFMSEYWAMEESKLFAIIDFLTMQADGMKFSAEEIEARIAPQTAAAVARKEGAVAIVPLRGVISPRASMMSDISGGASAEGFSRNIEQAAADPSVKAIVVDADTAGGNVMGIDEASATVAAVKGVKPIVVQVTGNLASAGYWIGCSADEIIMSPSSAAGAIGVRTGYDDTSAALQQRGVSREIISAGKYKGEGLLGPLSDETRAYMQRRIDDYYGMFVDRVAAGRNVSTDAVRNGFGQGRMLGAGQSVREGLADRVGSMKDTLARFGADSGPTSNGSAAPARARRARALALAAIS